MIFDWDDWKNASNLRKHGVRFEVATAVFYDPLHVTSRAGVVDGEERWRAIGRVGDRYLLVVIHVLEDDEDESIRILSAREATTHERREYEGDL